MPTKRDSRSRVGASQHPLLLDETPSGAESSALPAGAPAAGPSSYSVNQAGQSRSTQRWGGPLSGLQAAALALAAAGLVALGLGWYGASEKVEVWEQIPYLISGGFGGAMLLGVAITAWMAHEHSEDRRSRAMLAERIDRFESGLRADLTVRMDDLEMALAAEFDRLAQQVRLQDPISGGQR